MARPAAEADRGREAAGPSGIPAPGWRDVLLRIKQEVSEDNLSMIAAGVAFYAFLAIFPALAALVSIYGMAADPQQVQQLIATLATVMPENAAEVLRSQLQRIVNASSGALGLGALVGLLVTLWSAMSGMKAMITALNVAYEQPESRSFIWYNLTALLLTLGAIVFAILALALIAVVPAVLNLIELPRVLEAALAWLRWPLLALGVIVALGMLYRYAPNRDPAAWRWLSWGAVIATVLWLIVSAAFSFYVSNFGNYNETYGSIGAIVVLLLWLYLGVFVVLLGGEFNAELEHQTRRDTTTGPPQDMGRRGARMADTVGRQP